MRIEERQQRRGERLSELARTAAGTPMGDLLRRFWQPVAIAKHLAPERRNRSACQRRSHALPLGERQPAPRRRTLRAPRLTVLHTGWVDGEEIRCMLPRLDLRRHGPVHVAPGRTRRRTPNIKIAGYPLREYGGLSSPISARRSAAVRLAAKTRVRRQWFHVVRRQVWPCNWLQLVENSLDALHVSFVHARGIEGRFVTNVSQVLPDSSTSKPTPASVKLQRAPPTTCA